MEDIAKYKPKWAYDIVEKFEEDWVENKRNYHLAMQKFESPESNIDRSATMSPSYAWERARGD